MGVDRYGFYTNHSENADYLSPGGTIEGRIMGPDELGSSWDQRADIRLAEAKLWLSIDFRPNRNEEGATSYSEAVEFIAAGARDYLHLLHSLKGPRFRKVGVVMGWTNPRMARFAVKNLGLDWVTPERLVTNDPSQKVNVYGYKQVLIGQENQVRQLREKARGLYARRYSK